MQKYITKNRVFSSSSQQKPSIITPQKSLSKLKQRLNSGYVPYGTVSYNDRAKEEYMIRDNQKLDCRLKKGLTTADYKKRRRESLDLMNQDIKFENQLREEIKNLNLALCECINMQNDLIRQKNPENISSIVPNNTKQSSIIHEHQFIPKNLKQLAHLQQIIQNRDKQIKSVTSNIAQLKQQDCNLNPKKIPLQQKYFPSSNLCMDRFILADEVYELSLSLKATMREYQQKYNDLKALRVTINNSFKDNEYFYQLKVNESQKDKALLVEKPITYSQFKQNLQIKKKQTQKTKNHLQRIKSFQNFLPSHINQFSNISNVSALFQNNFVDEWLNRQLLPGEIPTLPKQLNPTMKSLQLKKRILKQAIETQKNKHEKQMTQMIDKLLFLHDEDDFLKSEIQNNESEINGLEARFSWIQTRTRMPTTVSQKSIPNTKRKILEEESSIHFVQKNNNKNYIEENLLLDNTANNSSLLDQTGKILKFS